MRGRWRVGAAALAVLGLAALVPSRPAAAASAAATSGAGQAAAATPGAGQAAWTISAVVGGLVDPVAVAVDPAGDLYVADAGSDEIDELPAGSQALTVVAGTGSAGFSGDGGPAAGAALDDPRAVAVDSTGDLFIADYGNDRVREVSASTHDITTVAGGGGYGFSPDGTAAAGAELEGPSGVAVDSAGDVFFSETSANRIRKITAGTGLLSTVAGDGAFGSGGDGGPAISAQLAGPAALSIDASGDLFVAEPGDYDVREISAAGTIGTVAGDGGEGDAGDDGPATSATMDRPSGVAVDSRGDIFVSEGNGERVREVSTPQAVIYTVAGTGVSGTAGLNGPALSAELRDPQGVAVNAAGEVFVADTGARQILEFTPPVPGECAGTVPVGTATSVTSDPADGGSEGGSGGSSGTTAGGAGAGYWVASSTGIVAAFGSAPCEGSPIGSEQISPIVGMAVTPDGGGYWLVTRNGGVNAFGDAGYHGSLAGTKLSAPVVGMASTPDGGGYWLVASDGGVFSFGDAVFHGSAGAERLNRPIVGMASTADGGGYWLVASDGGIFTYGDAGFLGSAGNLPLRAPIVGMASTADGGGYWLVASDGGIFTYGDAGFHGSAGSSSLPVPIVGMAATPDGGGYWMVASDGTILNFGDAAADGGAA